MADESTGNVTLLLNRWQSGEREALDQLLPTVYAELKRLAQAQLRRDGGATIQPTELVAEAYLKLIDVDQVDFEGRAHFFSIAARTMRRVLVERYRRREAAKRGSGETLLTLNSAIDSGERKPLELTRLDDALTDLEALDPRQAEIVTLKFFGGLDGEEIAAALSISTRTVKREWAMAKLWLGRAMAS
ncbi:MAG: sigma-70 family RNA polymerase sigma factor [Xanthomonadales bacterium]|nr:sigma-70 family RNA polymerase sigma factor [Xanthomonadales bacterium]